MSANGEADAALRFMETAASGLSWRARLELGCVVLVLVAAALAWAFWPPKPVPEVVTAAPQVVQADHSVIAERAPAAQAPKPRTILPKGAIPERDVSVVVAPAPGASSVQVDLQLVRMPDNGRRVIASSPDGQIVSALDIPIEAGLVPAPPKVWAAGLSYSTEREVGVWVERDLGRLRFGAEVAKGAGRPRAEVRVGVAF